MTVVVALLAVAVAVLAMLVAGLLRSHAAILQRLHEAGLGLEELDGEASALDRPATDKAEGADLLPMAGDAGAATAGMATSGPAASGPTDALELPRPQRRATAGRRAHDLVGTTPAGDARVVRTTRVGHDTLLLFLSSGCTTCQRFWDQLDAAPDGGPASLELPDTTRLVVVVKGPEHESPSAIAGLAPPHVTVVATDAAWTDFRVPGSPYAVLVDGQGGRVVGEGTGADLDQVRRFMGEATGDLGWVGGSSRRARRAARDATRERDTDAELLAAGILPGDPSLYRRADGSSADGSSVHGSSPEASRRDGSSPDVSRADRSSTDRSGA